MQLDRLYYQSSSYLVLLFVVITLPVFFLVPLITWLLSYPFDKRRTLLHRLTGIWSGIYFKLIPGWSLQISGRHKIDPDKTYIIVANHLSLADIMVMYRLNIHFKWVSKAEVFNIPIVGWMMRMNQYVPLVRGDKGSIQVMYDRCKALLLAGNSICMFPEGTRSETGQLKAFKHGAFVLAKETQVPILPLVIQGTQHALPKRRLSFYGRHRMTLTVLDEISPESFHDIDADELTKQVWLKIREEVETGDAGVGHNQYRDRRIGAR